MLMSRFSRWYCPSASPDGGTHIGKVQNLQLSTSIPGATIYYTTDGSTPDGTSSAYTGSLEITTTTNLCAIAIAPGESSYASCKVYTVSSGTLSTQVSAPVFSQAGGAVKVGDKVQVTTGTAGADLYWSASANYTTPTVCTWQAPVQGMLVVNFASTTMSQVTISVFAAKAGQLHSEIRSATFQVASASEDFSIGLGASRIKFKEQDL